MTRVAMAKADVVILIRVMRRSGNAEVSDEPTNSQVLTIPHASERMEHRPRMRRTGPKAEEGRLVGAEAAPCFAMAFYKGTH
jgi:hypothetical protein